MIKVISYAFEYAAQELLSGEYNERLGLLAFPIIRRIFTNGNDKETLDSETSHIKFDEENIKEISKNIILKLNKEVSNFDFDTKIENIDNEALFCSIFSDSYVL